MLTFETLNELTLKVTCQGNDVLFTKAGAFIAGESPTKTTALKRSSWAPRRAWPRRPWAP